MREWVLVCLLEPIPTLAVRWSPGQRREDCGMSFQYEMVMIAPVSAVFRGGVFPTTGSIWAC